MALTVVAMYDVHEDQDRARVAAVLQRWGDRIQRSVFVCMVEPEELPVMIESVKQIMDPDTDSFAVMRQCKTCWDAHVQLGQAAPPQPTLFWAAM